MPHHPTDQNAIIVQGCIILWDAMTRPDTNESGTKHGLKVAVPPSCPDVPLLDQLANNALANSEFKGVLPANGTMPLGTLGPSEYGGQFNGWRVFNAGTYRGVPEVWDDQYNRLDQMQWAPLMYSGQDVDLLIHCYVNNGKVKGVACGLDAVRINVAKNAPRQNFGGGPQVDTTAAFGQPGAAPAAAPAAPPAQPAAPAAPAMQQAHDMLPGGAAGGTAPAPGAAPAPAPAPPAAPSMRLFNGVAYSEDALVAAGHTPEMIATYPVA